MQVWLCCLGVAALLTGSLMFLRTPVRQVKNHSDALDALQFLSAQRAYPRKEIPDSTYVMGFRSHNARAAERFGTGSLTSGGLWQPLGPTNIGGRTLSLAFNPQNPNTLYAGSASGGLWRSYTAGIGMLVWHQVRTGYPVLAVAAVAIAPKDSNIMLIGTGEVYGKSTSIGGFTLRLTRGSYGIGILKSTNAGQSWFPSLDWSRKDQRGVQAIQFHPTNAAVVWAATTEGVYKSLDTGTTWTMVYKVPMVTDIVLHPADTSIAVIAAGNMGTMGTGIYKTTNGGVQWKRCMEEILMWYGGKAVLWMHNSPSPILYASIGLTSEAGTMLVRSLDFGSTWGIISSMDYAGYQAWYSHIVAVHPSKPEIVFCGGINLYRSLDSGRTLTRTGIGGVHADIHCAIFHPSDPSIIYLGTDGGVSRGQFDGQVYQPASSGYQTAQFYNGVSVSRIDTSFMFGGLQDNGTVLYSGSTWWTNMYGGDGCMSAINHQNNNIIWVTSQYLNLLRSSNKGYTWKSISPFGIGTKSFVGPFAVAESNPAVLYAGGTMIAKSTTYGDSWTTVNGGMSLDFNPALAVCISATHADTVYVSTAPISARSGFFLSTDGGATWMNRTGTLPDRYCIDIAADPKNSAVVYVTASGYGSGHLFQSTNAGESWMDITGTLPDVPTSAIAVDPRNASYLYAGNDLGVYHSPDGGRTWNFWSEGLPEAVIVMDLVFSPANNSLRVATHGNGIYERTLPVITSVREDLAAVPERYSLSQNYPNPFNPVTTIRYALPSSVQVQLVVYDMLGRAVATLADEQQSAGWKEVEWNGAQASSGIYFYTLTAGTFIETRKMLLLK